MKTLFSDTVVSKLRKIPTFGWVFFVFVSFFFAFCYEYLLIGEYTTSTMFSMYDEVLGEANLLESISPVSIASIGVIASLFEAAMATVIFELILILAYNVCVGRFRAQINRPDFKFRIRYAIIIANTIIGILSIGYFFTQKINGEYVGALTLFGDVVNYVQADNPYYTIQSSFLPFAVYTLVFGFFYEDFRKRYVLQRNQAKLFNFVAIIFVGISLVVSIVSFFVYFGESTSSTINIVASCLEIGTKLLLGVGALLNSRRLKKISDTPVVNVYDTTNDHVQKNIFDDFGF